VSRVDRGFKNLAKLLLICVTLLFASCGTPEERAQRHYERGVELLKKQDYVGATLELKNALQLNQNLVPAWLAMSQIEEHDQHWDKVGAILRKVVQLDPKNLDATVRLARVMLLAGQYDKALTTANAAANLDDRNASIHALKATILFKLNETGEAATEAQTALDIDPLNADALVVLAAYRLAKGDPDGALLLLNRDPEKHAKDLAVQLFKLRVYQSTGDLEKSEALLKNLIEYYPEQTEFRKQLVGLYLQQHRNDDAEKEVRAIAAAKPSEEANLAIVRFLLAVKGADAARQELNDRIKAGGDVFAYQMALADLYQTQGNITDATTLLESLSKSASPEAHALAAENKLAQIQFGQKNYEVAEKLITDVIAKDKRNIDALKLRAMIHTAQGEYEPAIADLREALNDRPGSADLLLLLAGAYERSGSIELAADQFAQASKASQSNPNVGLDYVAFLRRRGNDTRAEDVLVELAGRWPRNIRVLSALAQIKLEHQDWAAAQQLAESIQRIGANQAIADQILGEALAGQNKPETSINVLQEAYSAAPNAVQPMAAVVRAYVRAQQADKAEAFLQSVLQTNPSSAAAYTLLGDLQLQQGAPQKALDSYKAAIAKQPEESIGYEALANYYIGQKNYDEAIKTLQAGLEKKPDSFALRLALGGVQELKGDYEAAISGYEALLKDSPNSLVVINNLASLLADHRTDDASLERALSLAANLRSSPVPQFKDTLGWLHYRRGEYKPAGELLEAASNELPNLALVHYHLGMNYIALGQMQKASEELKKALELGASGSVSQEQIQAALKKAS
jgi:cellulose synthase operon protein C